MSRSLPLCVLALSLSALNARADEPRPVDFRTDVIAALSRGGCNQGACHGSPQGKNGFRLSLRGFDPDVDLFSLTRAEIGRRVNKASPESSLILLKGTGRVPHQGGIRFQPGDPAYQVLLRWIADGCRDNNWSFWGMNPSVAKLEVSPENLRLPSGVTSRQITVRAHFHTGEVR